MKVVRLLDDDSDESVEDIKDLAAAVCLSELRKRRYLERPKKHRKSPANERFRTDLNADKKIQDDNSSKSEMPWLTNDEFLQKYRVSRSSFQYIYDLIRDHPVFNSKTKRMTPTAHQLMVWLKYVGTEGSGASNSNQRGTFGVGYGTADLYRKRVTIALRSLSKEYIKWPDRDERKQLSKDIQRQFDFPHWIFFKPLLFFPQNLL